MFAPRDPKAGLLIAMTLLGIVLSVGFGLIYFRTFDVKNSLKAINLGSDQVVYFPFVSKFETGLDSSKLVFGTGFVEGLSTDLTNQASRFQRCRQFYLATTAVAKFRVNVLSELQKLQVRSLMEGADSNGPHAACLRDVLEDLAFPSLAKATKVDENRYHLVIELRSRVSAPVPREAK